MARMFATLLTALVSFAEPQGPALQFVDFASDLGKPSFCLVAGTLGKITEGKKERLKGGEGSLDEGGVMASVSGTVFTKVQATAKLLVSKPLHGTKDDTLTVAFDMQVAKLGDGGQRRHFLLTPRVPLEDGMLALWFLERDKGKLTIARVVRLDPKKPTNAETFTRLCVDLYAVNVRIAELKAAHDNALRSRATDKKGAIAVLQKALEKPCTLLEAGSENWRRMEIDPLEQKVRKVLEDLGVRPASRPSTDEPPLEGGIKESSLLRAVTRFSVR